MTKTTTQSIPGHGSRKESLRAGEAGFTLMELMVVVIILGLVAAFCLPSFYAMITSAEKHSVASQFQETCVFAHNRAIFQQEKVQMVINPEENSYWVKKIDEEARFGRGEEKKDKLVKLPKGFTITEVEFPEDERRRDWGEIVINFYPDGTTQEAVITIQREENDRHDALRLVLRLQRATGRAAWEEFKPDDPEYRDYG